jgi:methionine synthase II (cobalamin-independent)
LAAALTRGPACLQEAAGLDIVTDGEMRRLSFQSQMTEAVDGFGPWDINADPRGQIDRCEEGRARRVRLGVANSWLCDITVSAYRLPASITRRQAELSRRLFVLRQSAIA